MPFIPVHKLLLFVVCYFIIFCSVFLFIYDKNHLNLCDINKIIKVVDILIKAKTKNKDITFKELYDITNKNNGLNDFQEKWSARISDFENIRNKSTNHVVTSTNEKSILVHILTFKNNCEMQKIPENPKCCRNHTTL